MGNELQQFAPLSCRWIEHGTERRISNWTYALCIRVATKPRMVSEGECARCPRWEPPVEWHTVNEQSH